MPNISQRGVNMPASPIRKLVPLANQAKAKGANTRSSDGGDAPY